MDNQLIDNLSPDARAYIERTAMNQVLTIMSRSLIDKERFAELLVEVAEEIRRFVEQSRKKGE